MGSRGGGAPGRLTPVVRGLLGACGWCGGRGLFASVNELRERCPTCGLWYEREDGYWLGAMTVSISAVIGAFAVFFVGGMLLSWPDVPWNALLVGGVVLNGAIPLLGYGWAKTTWVGIDLAMHPPEPHEEADALTAAEAARREPSREELGVDERQ
jgi:uncharacterized protein (DUF983 family)